MNPAPGVGAPGAAPPRDDRARLRHMAQEMEAVFLAQLFQAMRASVPQDGLTGPSPEQDLFTALLDERVASIAAARMKRGMSEVLYRQLSRRLPAAGAGGTR